MSLQFETIGVAWVAGGPATGKKGTEHRLEFTHSAPLHKMMCKGTTQASVKEGSVSSRVDLTPVRQGSHFHCKGVKEFTDNGERHRV